MNQDTITFILFGGTGDLAYRKIYVSLFVLFMKYHNVLVVSISRKEYSEDESRKLIKNAIQSTKYLSNINGRQIDMFLQKNYYLSIDVGEMINHIKLQEYVKNCEKLENIDKPFRLFFFALPPLVYESALKLIEISNLSNGSIEKRLLIEKPFGLSHKSAMLLEEKVNKIFTSDEIYRIDHFLYRNIAHNLMWLKTNKAYRQIWNEKFIEHFEIICDQKDGILSRGEYFDKAGIIRDMFQSHIMQLVSILGSKDIYEENNVYSCSQKVDFLKCINNNENNKCNNMLFGQYRENKILKLLGYTSEKYIDKESKTETFFSGCFKFINTSWRQTLFYFRVVKGVKNNNMVIHIYFNKVQSNIRKISIYEDRINIILNNKKIKIMRKSNSSLFYDEMIIDAVKKNKANFSTFEEICWSWKFVDKIYQDWKMSGTMMKKYPRNIEAWKIDFFRKAKWLNETKKNN